MDNNDDEEVDAIDGVYGEDGHQGSLEEDDDNLYDKDDDNLYYNDDDYFTNSLFMQLTMLTT